MQDQVRVLRVLEYIGDRAAIEDHFENVIQGSRRFEVHRAARGFLGTITIHAVTLGQFPEVLETAKGPESPKE